MVKNQTTESELIRLGFEESISGDMDRDEKPVFQSEFEIFCEPCADLNMDSEATHESWNVEMCYDCYMEFNE
jgi:hypothetical protein